MNNDPREVVNSIIQARHALRAGDRTAARRWAEKAVSLDPNLEEGWLILGSLSTPRASIAYYERAAKINPQSTKARQGLHDSIERLRKEQKQHQIIRPGNRSQRRLEISPSLPSKDNKPNENPKKYVEPKTKPTDPSHNPGISLIPIARGNSVSHRSLSKNRWSIFALLMVIFCAVILWAFWPGGAANVLAYISRPTGTGFILGEKLVIFKPTYTSTFTATFTPTPTATSTPTPTNTATPTLTSTPTNSPVPTNTFMPVATKPQDEFPENGATRWIDVDLSEQMLYAYEGNVLVASFLVSTGVPAYPTVTGRYHIYAKYVSTLMTGPGYYLPNVPYTMYFYKGYGIHGTYWHNNFGHPMSHGCVNMYTPDAEWMFYWASIGTLVNVHY